MEVPEFSVSEFVAVTNQALEYALAGVVISGELANFRVSKNRWVYFDLKDEESSVRFFGTVYMLPGPLEDGMMLKVRGTPRLHPRYGFSVNVTSVQPAGEGSIKKAASLLEAKLTKEGLFAPERKRALPYPPESIGLITSSESAAYADFMKIIGHRWAGLSIMLADVQVQGEASAGQVVEAISDFNQLPEPPEVLVITRGGGSSEDLAAFSDERVVRAVAGSRIPTLVAVGHELDVSLAELAADQRASTPSNAAELLVPDKQEVIRQLKTIENQLSEEAKDHVSAGRSWLELAGERLETFVELVMNRSLEKNAGRQQLLAALNPSLPLKRGYALVRDSSGKIVRKSSDISENAKISVEISDAELAVQVEKIYAKQG